MIAHAIGVGSLIVGGPLRCLRSVSRVHTYVILVDQLTKPDWNGSCVYIQQLIFRALLKRGDGYLF